MNLATQIYHCLKSVMVFKNVILREVGKEDSEIKLPEYLSSLITEHS